MLYILGTTLFWLVVWTVLGVRAQDKRTPDETLKYGVGLMLVTTVALSVGEAIWLAVSLFL